jgi:DNA-binding response OmpR family regulator
MIHNSSLLKIIMKKKINNKDIKILIVDDEPNIVVAIEFLLMQAGYTIEKAFNGQEAMEKVTSFNPNIIVLDVMMPEMDGFETARQIRLMEGKDDIRIVFLTAKGTQQDRKTGYAVGGEIYLIKPFDNDILVSTIDELVKFG